MGVEKAPSPPVGVVAEYATHDLLMSGWAIGEEAYLGGEAAMMNVGLGEGEVVLYGFRLQFRGQLHGTYKLIFNALYAATLENLIGPGGGGPAPEATPSGAPDE